MEEGQLSRMVQDYLKAFDQRDLDRCLDFFDENGTVNFAASVFQGREAIKEWHEARFEADMRIARVDTISVEGDKVVVEGVITSNKLKAWQLDSLDGKVTILHRDGKAVEASFDLLS